MQKKQNRKTIFEKKENSMTNTVFDGFEPKNEQVLLAAIEKYLDMRYPNRLQSEIVAIKKKSDRYGILLKNNLMDLEVEMQFKHLDDYKSYLEKKVEKEKMEEAYFQKNRLHNS